MRKKPMVIIKYNKYFGVCNISTTISFETYELIVLFNPYHDNKIVTKKESPFVKIAWKTFPFSLKNVDKRSTLTWPFVLDKSGPPRNVINNKLYTLSSVTVATACPNK